MAMLLNFLKRTRLDWAWLIGLSLVVASIAWSNYTPGTWLSGWDNLHPEFDFALNVRRSLTVSWQEYQGLGLAGGMSHAADLPRQLILWGLSAVLPHSTLRYVWHLGMLWLGTMGTYVLLRFVFTHKSRSWATLAAGTGATVYLLNLATIQNFWVPFDAFSSFYGFLPWLLWSWARWLHQGGRRRWLSWFGINLLAASAFYVQTLFVVFVLLWLVLSLETVIRQPLQGLKRVVLGGFALLFAHSYWLFPALYFTFTHAEVTVNAKINQLSTVETQLMNQAFGDLGHIAQLKSFWWEYADYNGQKYAYILDVWRKWADQPGVSLILLAVFGLAVIGAATMLFRRTQKFGGSLLLGGLLILVMLSAGAGWLGVIFESLVKMVPLFGQMFRSPFTKWSVAAALWISWSVAALVSSLSSPGRWQTGRRWLAGSLAVVVIAGSIMAHLPLWQGNLFYGPMRAQIPNEYFSLMQFMKTQPTTTRMITLPLPNFWGWNFYDWGYRGSGFLWYGIEQPIVDRAFDVWSGSNESLYQQLSAALYDNDEEEFLRVLDQYDVRYALLDESMISPERPLPLLRRQTLQKWLTSAGGKPTFAAGKLQLWDLGLKTAGDSFISSPVSHKVAAKPEQFQRAELQYQQLGNFISEASDTAQVAPFATLTKEKPEHIVYEGENIKLAEQLPSLMDDSKLELPALATGSSYTTTVTVTRQEKNLKLSFPQSLIETTSTRFMLPQLSEMQAQLTTNPESAFVEIGGKNLLMSRQQSHTVAVTLTVGEPIAIHWFDATKVQEFQGQKVIDERAVNTITQPSTVWLALIKDHQWPLEVGDTFVTVTLRAEPIELLPQAFTASPNCDVFNRGKISKSKTDRVTEYTATAFATVCDGVIASTTSVEQGYLLRWQGKTVSGRSMKFFIQNLSTEVPVLQGLLPTGEFDQTYSLLPASTGGNSGYSLNWQTRSFGELAQNQLTGLNMYPLPTNQLLKLRVVPLPQPKMAQATITEAERVDPFLYRVTATSTSGQSVIALSQAFDDDWVAIYDLKQVDNEIIELPHLVWNGWANAWVMASGNYRLLLFYLPQGLQWLGLIFLGGGFVTSTGIAISKLWSVVKNRSQKN